MVIGKFWKENKPFDCTENHDFEPTEQFRLEAVKISKLKTVNDDAEETEKMHECKHLHWTFKLGFPCSLLCCKDCAYWQFF